MFCINVSHEFNVSNFLFPMNEMELKLNKSIFFSF